MDTRGLWIDHLTKLASPVLRAAAEHRLKRDMPVEQKPVDKGGPGQRELFTYLEAVGRTLAGVAPFIELGEDDAARQLAPIAREAIHNILDPQSPDVVDFNAGSQIIVDAAFLAHGLLRAPKTLWEPLDAVTKKRLIEALKLLRTKVPGYNNWLLFASIAEACLRLAGEAPDPMRVEFALRQHDQWYAGGGWYNDGDRLHHDYYNSFVIQPMLIDTAETLADRTDWTGNYIRKQMPEWISRAQRWAEIQERMISPDGSYPVTGRSITYRGGAFQLLAMMALRKQLPETVTPAQVRVALTSVLRRTMEAPSTYDDKGWLRIGLAGHQPGLGEGYISTGSLYLSSTIFLPLGLPAADPFWADADVPTTWTRAWSGVDLPADHG
jgi:hypothetical protein